MKKVVVVGAGPAGIFASYFASKSGADVILIEKNSMIGKKLRITGKGRCNICNASDIESIIKNIYKNGNFMYSSIYSFSNEDVMNVLKEHGLEIKVERGNRVFPKSDKAIDVVKTLDRMLNKEGVKVYLNTSVKKIVLDENTNSACGIITENGKHIAADSVIIATGGVSYPLTGSTGDGYKFAKQCGHTVSKLKASLVGIEVDKKIPGELVGLNLRNISINLYKNNKKIYEDFGELEFRNYGIDGPVIKSASCYIDDEKNDKCSISLDLKPALSHEKLDMRIQRDFAKNMNKTFEKSLGELLPKKIIDFVIEISGIDKNKLVHQITKVERKNLVDLLKNINFDVVKLRPIEEAIVTSGGIVVKEINPSTMESKFINGLYFSGEVIDVDAFTGGYNLQVAFSTGYLAGINASSEK
ncbi:BaiN/RdsA family NAD(P)/FAD-dependent oxidoreductase [Peptostreptococcus faecalis]|uniref:NAD(P)/FAD-dependent oxidoreductase n=1 Tax=Peptostreptococcus faecalis TaxID=2045015 RepID=UPI000C7BD5C2|nr:NAD(P)/FAD-dependent oxidoreductase [Peptostreptococcus faecalis]